MKRHILIVEDDETLGTMLKSYLNLKGFNVSHSKTCKHADAILRKHDIDLMILDKSLNGEDGLEYCKRLKQDAIHSKIRIVLTSGYDHLKTEVKKWGADDFIAKPYELHTLMQKIENQLQAA